MLQFRSSIFGEKEANLSEDTFVKDRVGLQHRILPSVVTKNSTSYLVLESQ